MGLIEAARDVIGAGALVPCPHDQRWRWQPAPPPEMRGRLEQVQAAAHSSALFTEGDPAGPAAMSFLIDLVNALAPEPAPELGSRPTSWRRWAGDELIAHPAAARARLAILLEPPQVSDDGGWALAPLAIDLADPTTRIPVAKVATSAPFAALPPEVRSRWREAESAALRAAWPKGPLRDLSPCPLTEIALLEFLDTRAEALTRVGIDVLATGGLLRPAQVRRRVSASAGTGLLTAGALALAAEVSVDGEVLTKGEIATLADSKSELVSVRGRWMRLSDSDRARIARMLAVLESDPSVAEALASDAFDGAEWDVSGLTELRPARAAVPPPEVRATLRHYQRAGLDWLTWMENGVGGILADDMGLGKTLQVCTGSPPTTPVRRWWCAP